MNKRVFILLALLAATVGGFLLLSPPLRAADPPGLACPNGQTVLIEGQSPPNEALLLYLRGRPVGGGLADGQGRYSLPLRPQERPGIYLVEVRLRSSRALVASYTCYIDVALDTPLSPTPTFAGGPPTSTSGAAATASPTATASGATTRPTARPTSGVATPTTTTIASATTVAPTTTVTPTAVPADTIEIEDIYVRDLDFPDEPEYIELRNTSDSPINLAGWRLINASRIAEIPPYTFPDFELEVDVSIVIYSTIGDDDPDFGEFFWNRSVEVWRVGDRAELRDPQNRVITTLLVPNQVN